MSNKTQISCNHQNRLTLSLIKAYWQRIKLDYIELFKSINEVDNLFNIAIEKRKRNQNIAIQIIELVRILKRVKFIKERINMINEWRLEKINKLIIC